MALIDEFYLTDIAHKGDILRAANGDADKVSGIANLYQALHHRLLTEKGTLLHRPEYGVGVKAFQNAPNSISNQQALALRIQENFLRDPRVERVAAVRIDPQSDPSLVIVHVKVDAKGYGEVSMAFNPFGGDVS